MADIVSEPKRSEMMAGIRATDTRPEMIVRRGLHRMGFRFRLHDRRLPGRPDLVLRKHRAVIFVHGCFWHAHDCHLFKWPKTRARWWREKIEGNARRDDAAREALLASGWRVMEIWECALKGRTSLSPETVIQRTSKWLRSSIEFERIEGRVEPAA